MSKTKQPQELTITVNKHWGAWAKGYLKIAELWFKYLQEQPHIGRTKYPFNSLQYNLTDWSLIVASIWNIKHSIELLIKWLGIQIDKKYLTSHNLNFLVNELETKIKSLCIDTHLNILKKLVSKYYQSNFAGKKQNLDSDNTLFKYPENKNGSLDYTFVHNLKRKDINQFLRDIHNLRRIYDILEWQPKHFQNYAKIGLSKKEIEKNLLRVSTIKNPELK